MARGAQNGYVGPINGSHTVWEAYPFKPSDDPDPDELRPQLLKYDVEHFIHGCCCYCPMLNGSATEQRLTVFLNFQITRATCPLVDKGH